MIVVVITETQKELIDGKEYAPDSLFNPILDADNEWVISQEEVEHLSNMDYSWLLNCPTKEHNPIIIDMPYFD